MFLTSDINSHKMVFSLEVVIRSTKEEEKQRFIKISNYSEFDENITKSTEILDISIQVFLEPKEETRKQPAIGASFPIEINPNDHYKTATESIIMLESLRNSPIKTQKKALERLIQTALNN